MKVTIPKVLHKFIEADEKLPTETFVVVEGQQLERLHTLKKVKLSLASLDGEKEEKTIIEVDVEFA